MMKLGHTTMLSRHKYQMTLRHETSAKCYYFHLSSEYKLALMLSGDIITPKWNYCTLWLLGYESFYSSIFHGIIQGLSIKLSTPSLKRRDGINLCAHNKTTSKTEYSISPLLKWILDITSSKDKTLHNLQN